MFLYAATTATRAPTRADVGMTSRCKVSLKTGGRRQGPGSVNQLEQHVLEGEDNKSQRLKATVRTSEQQTGHVCFKNPSSDQISLNVCTRCSLNPLDWTGIFTFSSSERSMGHDAHKKISRSFSQWHPTRKLASTAVYPNKRTPDTREEIETHITVDPLWPLFLI